MRWLRPEYFEERILRFVAPTCVSLCLGQSEAGKARRPGHATQDDDVSLFTPTGLFHFWSTVDQIKWFMQVHFVHARLMSITVFMVTLK